MNYEFALQLKKAGFPQGQKWQGKVAEFENLKTVGLNLDKGDGEIVYLPTLSELIEMCGKGLQSLINNFYNEKGGWIAFTNRKDEQGERMDIWGATPEEAVANLWLSLNKVE